MENRDNFTQQGNMAEAAVESPAARFFCHMCTLEISPVLPDYVCPQCQSGFIEELSQSSAEPSDESDEDFYSVTVSDNPEDDTLNQVTELWNMLSHLRRPDGARSVSVSRLVEAPLYERGRYAPRARAGPSRRARDSRLLQRRSLPTGRNRAEGFLQELVSTLSENAGFVTNTGFPVFLNLHSNPGDYAWGRGSWNAIITQLINQLDGTGPPPLPKEKINEIPFVNISQEQVDKNLQCTVCMDDFKLDESVRRLACDHHFHNDCITPWLELHGTCPICRKLLTDSSQENLFSNPPDVLNPSSSVSQGYDENADISESDASRRNEAFNPHQSSIYDFNDEFD